MWAQQLVAPGTFAEVDVPPPAERDLGEGDVLLRVLAGGICGSDLPAFLGRSTSYVDEQGPSAAGVPGFPMHEVVGEVLASHHPDHRVGARVVGWASRFDAIAERTITRGADVAPFAPGPAPARAIMLQPLACVLYALEQIPRIRGTRAVVLGQGPIGLLFSHALKAAGAASVTGVDNVDRADFASRFGVDETVHAYTDRWVRHLADADRPDLVIEAIGHNVGTLGDAVTAVGTGGLVYYFGVADEPVYPLDMRALLRKNLTLMSGTTRQRSRMLTEADAYLGSHPELAEAYVTHVLPAQRAQQAFELAVRPAPGQLKIVLGFDGPA